MREVQTAFSRLPLLEPVMSGMQILLHEKWRKVEGEARFPGLCFFLLSLQVQLVFVIIIVVAPVLSWAFPNPAGSQH